jgi:hypothetical protein
VYLDNAMCYENVLYAVRIASFHSIGTPKIASNGAVFRKFYDF